MGIISPMNNTRKYKIATLGCRTNQYESAAFATQLREMGFAEAKENEKADLCIVNTCTVTEGADRSSRYQIRNLARQHPEAKIVVTGCLAERTPKEIQDMPEVSLVVGNQMKEQLLAQVFPEEDLPEFAIDHFGGHTRSFVKIQDGCNSFCTYCILPYVRGRSKSRPKKEILSEIHQLIANGYKEVVLTGINIGDFDGAPEEGEAPLRLAELVREVDQIEGLERLRISSIDPDEVDEDLLDAIINGKKTCHSMHIVLQSGSNAILKKMNRKYTKQIFLDSVEKLKVACSDFTFTTDVIVGFPGETENDFEETLDIMRNVRFAKVHMFPYSARPRTRAALYPNQTPTDIIQMRKQKVLRMAEQIAFELRAEYVGRKMKMLVETEESHMPGFFSGLTENFLQVYIPKEESIRSNAIISVHLKENTPQGFCGEICR